MSALLDYLQGRGVTFQVIPHARATPEDAGLVGLPEDEVVKTVVLVTQDGIALAVIPGTSTLDLDLARTAVGDQFARIAQPGELERRFPEYEAGTLPPLGLFFEAPMYVDPAVLRMPTVTFAGGKQTLSIRMVTRDLFRDDPVVITPLVRTAEPRATTEADAEAGTEAGADGEAAETPETAASKRAPRGKRRR